MVELKLFRYVNNVGFTLRIASVFVSAISVSNSYESRQRMSMTFLFLSLPSVFRRVRKGVKKRLVASTFLSVRPSVLPHRKIRLALDGFS